MKTHGKLILAPENLQALLDAMSSRGFEILGPTVRDGAILYDRIRSTKDLPIGFTDRQEKGTYRLAKRSDNALFSYVMGANSWKRFLHVPERRLLRAEKEGNRFTMTPETEEVPKYAFFGVRSCEIHALELMDRVLLNGLFVDQGYKARREGILIVAANCVQPGGTCFCVSMGTGPRAVEGFDLCLTELMGGQHRFLIEVGSDLGEEIMAEIPTDPATQADLDAVDKLMHDAAGHMGRKLETEGLKDALYAASNHSHWEEIAQRCLCCGNCTLVCPTCFCTTVVDTTDLSGDKAERWRRWDSCFSQEFSYIHGGSVRLSSMSRYRQWLTHKLASWNDQFGDPGCVGCGRCITWCPVGIDITEEAKVLRIADQSQKGGSV